MIPQTILLPFVAFALICPYAVQADVTITALDDRLRVEFDGALFTEYHFKGAPKPYLYPIMGPGNAAMTRNFPMKDVPGETKDHPHHRGLYYGHGSVNGVDFWGENPAQSGRTVHEEFLEVRGGATTGVIRARNRLVTVDNRVIGTDERTLRFYQTPYGPMIDFEITHHASHGDLIFNDTKEGTMAIRVPETLVHRHGRVAAKHKREGLGHIVNSEGVREGATWGKRARWVDYHGPVDGRTVGIAMFDHPGNPRHPTWWHVREYGLFAANPFGVHDFERLENPQAGELKVPAGKSVTFRYRFFFHAGDEKSGQIAERYQDYIEGP